MTSRAALAALAMLVASAAAAQTRSEYTAFDTGKDCAVVARAAEGDGDWAELVCRGYANYPFVVRYADVRETIAYGFGAGPGMAGFAPFNHAHDTVEWRVRDEDGASRPFAAIQRWFVARPDGQGRDREVLVVSRVGPPSDWQGCAVAYLLASGDPAANETARRIADRRAADFRCGRDRPEVPAALEGMVAAP